MIKKKRKEELNYKKSIMFIVISLLITAIILSFLSILVNLYSHPVEEKEFLNNAAIQFASCDGDINSFVTLNDSTRVKMYLPAVDSEGAGVNTALTVEASPGTGRTLTDIDNLLFWADTQHSIRVARRVAENLTGKKMEDYDIVYTIEANASLIGGPSAGAALTIATIAALQNKKVRENVMITGGINHDGSISPVSGILEKAKAAKIAGAGLFLVPLLQSRDVVYEESEHCEIFGSSEICTTETRPKKIDVQQESGITIKEVETIPDAMEYFFE